MVEVEKYIKRLLYDQDCVIIPDFGGVLTSYMPARFEPSSGRYLPSERKVAFNEVLKIDDGLLAKFISENEGLPYGEAKRHIADFVQTVLSLIKKNKIVTLVGIGSFHLSPEGRVVFQPDSFRNFHTEFYGLPPVNALDLKQQQPVTGEAKPVKYEIEVSSPRPYITQSKPIAWGNWISAASIACILVYVSAVLSREPGETSSLSPVETVRSFISGTEKGSDMPEVIRPAGGVNYDLPAKTSAEAVDIEDNKKEDAVAAGVVSANELTVSRNKFFVIASVYESEGSLNKYGTQMTEKLRSQGYESIRTLTVRDKYMLSAGEFSTWHEAQKMIPALSKTAKGAWIYKKR